MLYCIPFLCMLKLLLRIQMHTHTYRHVIAILEMHCDPSIWLILGICMFVIQGDSILFMPKSICDRLILMRSLESE